MGSRFSPSGFVRQLGIDIATLTCRRVRGGPTLAQRAIALDRIVGSAFLACVTVTAFWLANQVLPAGLLRMPLASESAQAAPGAPDMVLQELSAEAAARPLTRSDIKMLQGRLWSLGFDPGTIDGIAGRRTLAALNRYRAGKSLDRVAHIDRAAVADLLN